MHAVIQPVQFDRNDPANFGRPSWFHIDDWLSLIEQYITCDEVERAMWLLDNPPAFYRDFYPRKAKELRDKLLTQFFTATDYAKDPVTDDQIGACDFDVPRAKLVTDYVRKMNIEGIIPHIAECAPGNYWLPFVLKRQELGFTYFGASLDPDLQKRASEKIGAHWSDKSLGYQTAFVCFEMIEHLHNPVEIYQSYLKTCPGGAQTIFLSTPKYTFGGGMSDWFENPLGHLRAYTPREFHQFAVKHWHDFKWSGYDGHVMCLVGEK